MAERLVPLPHTERFLPKGAEDVAALSPKEPVSVTVYLRKPAGQPELPDPDRADLGLVPVVPDAELAAAYGADQADIDRVIEFAQRAGLTVTDSSAIKRSVTVKGPADKIQKAFGVQLRRYRAAGEVFRGRTGPVNVPEGLADIVEAVFGLDDRRVGMTRLRRNRRAASRIGLPTARANGLPANTYLPPAVAQMYRFPPGTDGTGQRIAILNFNDPESHGGYSADALKVFFEQVLAIPVPDITDVVVHGQGNDPGTDDGTDPFDTSGEVMLDVQMVGGCAPKAEIIMYFTQFTEQGWVDAINAIVTDPKPPTVISVSYGNPEDDPRSAWTAAAIGKVNEAFQLAAARGITICCAAGDDGSRDQAGDGRAHVDFPASSPYVLGCGGTQVIAPHGTILEEVVWNNGPGSATGGGVSRLFPVPNYQRYIAVPLSANPEHQAGRGVPDVCGLADPETGVVIATLDGEHLAVIGGTSATAPMWSSLVARLVQGLGRPVGFVNPLLYRLSPYPVFRDITQGSNGAYHAQPGWDACTGLGSPDGITLLSALRALLTWLEQNAPHRAGDHISAQAPGPTDGQPPNPDSFTEIRTTHARDLAEAWQQATELASKSEPDRARTTFGHAAEAAYLDCLTALKRQWAEVDLEDLDPLTLLGMGQTLAAVGATQWKARQLVEQS
jgi:kumamolisin